MTAPLMRHCAGERTPELSLAQARWFADERVAPCGYRAEGNHILTGASMTPDAAIRFSRIDEANGFATERISVVRMGDEPPGFRAMIVRPPAAGFAHEQPALWEYWTDRGWSQIGPPRKRFEPLLQEDIDDDDD